MSGEFSPSEDAANIAAAYGELPTTQAVAIGGSHASGMADERSDLDVYVYSSEPPDLRSRRSIASRLGQELELNENLWEPSDQWRMRGSSLHVDVIFRTQPWIEQRLASVLEDQRVSFGYTTSLWYNVLHSRCLFDRDAWFADLQASYRRPYPEALRTAIIAKNFPVLGSIGFSYIHQLELALERQDVMSVVHRTSAFIASYFDVLFAANMQPHPGEKRLLEFSHALCAKLPENMDENLLDLCTAPPGPAMLAAARKAETELRNLLQADGLL